MLGGHVKVAEILETNRQTIHKWTVPKDQGGRGGLIPSWNQIPLLEYAREHGIPLTAETLIYGKTSREKRGRK